MTVLVIEHELRRLLDDEERKNRDLWQKLEERTQELEQARRDIDLLLRERRAMLGVSQQLEQTKKVYSPWRGFVLCLACGRSLMAEEEEKGTLCEGCALQ